MKEGTQRRGFRLFTITVTITLTLFISFLLFYIITFSGFTNFIDALFSTEIVYALGLSLLTATLSTLMCLAVALPTAYALARYRFTAKSLVTAIIDIPLALPSLVVGFGLLIFFGTTAIGRGLQDMGFAVVFTPLGIILAQFTVNISAMIRIMRGAFESVNPRFEYVARTLGCSRFRAAVRVLLPMARKGLFAAVAITWCKGIGEFGAVIMIAGTTRMKTETLPVALFLNMSAGQLETAAAAASILIFISFLSLLIFEKYVKGKTVI